MAILTNWSSTLTLESKVTANKKVPLCLSLFSDSVSHGYLGGKGGLVQELGIPRLPVQ